MAVLSQGLYSVRVSANHCEVRPIIETFEILTVVMAVISLHFLFLFLRSNTPPLEHFKRLKEATAASFVC